ncbi:MAG: RDD family protein [Desulfobacterales bacterium]|nr:RDD family protein [Desulfobacterales bacterium]MDJ0886703.1 RDD family protein [Desulfobacterales bacterium]
MDWFYRLHGEETGPVGPADLKALFRAGTISADTEVRRHDMADWRPLRHFVKGAPQPKPAADAPPESEADESPREWDMPAATETGAPADATCSECGRAFKPGDLIRIDDARICGDCKPSFIQKLRQSAGDRGSLVYAGFWIRFGAKLIDGLVLLVVNLVVGLGLLLAAGGSAFSGEAAAGNLFLQIVYHAVGLVYTTFFLGRFGATPGKMACGLKVVFPDGRPIGYARALGRQLAEYLSGMLLMLGYLMAAFDGEKRTLHDRICTTRVVRS